MKELCFLGLMYIIAGIVLVVVIKVAAAPFQAYSCQNYGKLTERKTDFSIWNGCFVEYKGKYIPRSELEKRMIMNLE
ncbi:hypothetical protein [Acinetobacter phage vB_AbaM_fThrA]|nr:hypothetical protein [Acinetobacter phage vB_AbaM_fThrA]